MPNILIHFSIGSAYREFLLYCQTPSSTAVAYETGIWHSRTLGTDWSLTELEDAKRSTHVTYQ
jgi:hypothetical protein